MNISPITIVSLEDIADMTAPVNELENVELRAVLEKAVEDAQLNVTERMALNKKFYPNGGGFELFSKESTAVPAFVYYINKNGTGIDDCFIKQTDLSDDETAVFDYYFDKDREFDSFTREAESLKIPEYISRIRTQTVKSSKSNYQANLDNALKKLKKVLKGNI